MDWMQRDRIVYQRKFYVHKINRDDDKIIADWGVYSGKSCLNMIDDPDATEEMFAMDMGTERSYPLHEYDDGRECTWVRVRRIPDNTPIPVYPTFKESIINWFLTCPFDISKKHKCSS